MLVGEKTRQIIQIQHAWELTGRVRISRECQNFALFNFHSINLIRLELSDTQRPTHVLAPSIH